MTESVSKMNDYRQSLYYSALMQVGSKGFRDEKARNDHGSLCSNTMLTWSMSITRIPQAAIQEIIIFLLLQDLLSLSLVSKFFYNGEAMDPGNRWQKMKLMVEDRDDFIGRFCEMHSWYKHLGDGLVFHMSLDTSQSSRYSGEKVLYWNYADRYRSTASQSVKLNCLFGKRNLSAAYGRCTEKFLGDLKAKYGPREEVVRRAGDEKRGNCLGNWNIKWGFPGTGACSILQTDDEVL